MLAKSCALILVVTLVNFRKSLQDSLIILENVSDDNCGPCYRRLFTGKKMLEMFVRRAIECQRIEDCHRACDREKLFVCAGFNYRHREAGENGICELTSTPYPRTNVERDFAVDPQCDYYEKDLNCPPEVEGSRRGASWSYDRSKHRHFPPGPFPPGRTDSSPHKNHWKFFDQLPRPLDFNPAPSTPEIEGGRAPPFYGTLYEPNDSYYQRPYSPPRTYPERPYPPRKLPIDDREEDRKYPATPTYEEFYFKNFERPYPPRSFVDRRTSYEPYPQDLGTNEIGPSYPDQRKDPNRYWGVYGGIYGSSYPHDTSNINNFDGKNLSQHSGRPVHHNSRPYENDHFYGEFYNYGGAFGYGDNYAPSYKDFVYGGSGRDEECSIRAGAGFKLRRAIVAKSYLTPNLDQCESLCVNEKAPLCMTFAYRYNVASTDPTDNCLLSELPYRDLNFYTDLVPDRDYDIYAVIGDVETCNKNKPSNQPPPDECFWRVRSGFGMPPEVTKKTAIVEGIGECQIECALSRDFTCRSFAFRYGHERNRQDSRANCFLSDWPSQEIDPATMPDMDGAELYERGSFGRGCEPHPLPPFNALRAGNDKAMRGDEACYAGYHRPCKLTPYAVLISTRAESEDQCRAKCTQMRNRDPTPCMSFSFRISGDERDENCLLSDVPIRDLRPGLDYTYDDQHVLYAWRELDPRCYVSIYSLDDEHVFGAPSFGPGRPLSPGPVYIGPGSGHSAERRPGGSSGRPRPPYEPVSVDYPNKPLGSRPIGSGYGDRPVGNDYGNFPVDGGYGVGERPLDPDRPDPIGPSYGIARPRPDPVGPSYGLARPRPDPIDPAFDQGRPRPGSIGPAFDQGRPRPDPIGPTFDQGRPRPDLGAFYGAGGPRPAANNHGFDKPNRYGQRPGPNGYHYGFAGGYPAYKPSFSYPDELATFQHFTVNGYPCKRGTRCEKNKIAGFWSCETEGSEFGSWDYCCAPNSRCGYSRGYHYPWCYVGLKEDQWRPCSDKYYPYLPSPRPLRPKPKSRSGDDGDPRFDANPPALDFSARHWPVVYVHGEAPPNCTDSVASADDSRNPRLNKTTRFTPDDTSPAKQKFRKRRVRARTVVDDPAKIRAAENSTWRQTSDRFNDLNRANIDFVRVRTIDNNAELPLMDARDGGKREFNASSDDSSSKKHRAGKIERVAKPSISRATNSTVLPID